jgi:hypothetical protein
MSWKQYVLASLVVGIAFSTALTQTPNTQTASPTKQAGRPGVGAPPLRVPGISGGTNARISGSTVPGARTSTGIRREPCWQLAGVAKSAMDQRRTISMETRQAVEAVCANASLSAIQKQQRIREIHQQERLQMEALISPVQRDAMHACQQQRGGGTHGGGGNLIGGHGAGPCGTLTGVPKRLNEVEVEESTPRD